MENKILSKKILSKVVYNENNITLINGDSLKLLKEIKENTVDLIFSDPPYFLSNNGISCHSGKMVSVNKGEWDTLYSYKEINKFNKLWLKECRRILKSNGCIWISGSRHNIFSIGNLMNELEYKILNIITWEKPNPPPNLSCRYFTHSTEQIIWGTKNGKSKHLFNYQLMKEIEKKWTSKNKQMKDVWSILPPRKFEKRYGKHPTQKPEELLELIIQSNSNEMDVILDPFNGSGTTGVVSKRLNRKYIGIEMNDGFLEISKNRIIDEDE
jgi:site-specific DNA-methyltransferase (adenine-specific)